MPLPENSNNLNHLLDVVVKDEADGAIVLTSTQRGIISLVELRCLCRWKNIFKLSARNESEKQNRTQKTKQRTTSQ